MKKHHNKFDSIIPFSTDFVNRKSILKGQTAGFKSEKTKSIFWLFCT